MSLCICVCVPHAGFGTPGGEKDALDPLDLDFQTDASFLVGSRGRGRQRGRAAAVGEPAQESGPAIFTEDDGASSANHSPH